MWPKWVFLMKKIALCVDSSCCCSFSQFIVCEQFVYFSETLCVFEFIHLPLHKGANISMDVTSWAGMAKLQEGLGSSELTQWVMVSGANFPQSDSALTGNKDQREALCHNFLWIRVYWKGCTILSPCEAIIKQLYQYLFWGLWNHRTVSSWDTYTMTVGNAEQS